MKINHITISGLAIVIVVFAALFAMRLFAVAPQDIDRSLSKLSDGKLYAVAIEPEISPVTQGPLHNWVVTLAKNNGDPVPDATIVVDGGMPQHGHGLPTVPQVSNIGEGVYRIDGIRFNMGGWWEIHLKITGPAGEDEVTFNIVL